MATSPYPSSCLSERSHENRISDVTLHYGGCLPIGKRKRFFDGLSAESQQRILRRHAKIAHLREKLETVHQNSTAGGSLRAFKQAMNQWRTAKNRPPPYPNLSSRAPSSMGAYHWEDSTIDAEIKASVIYIHDSQPHDVPGISGSFPNQKITVKELLANDAKSNPLMQPCPENTVRYFHLPANNMMWVEEAIARYYHEERPDSDDFCLNHKHRRSRTKTEMLLQPEFWQGQRNFDHNSEVHARHMRPFCDTISINPISTERAPRNMVLFMPHLHWETDRGRMMSAECAKEASKQKLLSVSEVVNQAQNKSSHGEHVHDDAETQEDFITEPLPRKMALGYLLRCAASLLESMEFHTEEQLTYKYLHERPPLHPRRTLDQSYYGALKNTGTRDRDQVVYRGTKPGPHECVESATCRQCREDIRKVPRLVMVDQLWLWILDEQTVISSFPRRWGKNRPDPSAIHKSLRTRLQNAPNGEIASAYDLALIIVDECSRTFFDRTQLNERQPNLVELFAGAIRGVTYKQTAAFDQFLVYTHLASSEYRRQRQANMATQNTLLNINPEGNLLKEVKDIMDEIHIIAGIQEQQQMVIESFVKNIRLALTPVIRRTGIPAGGNVSSSWDILLSTAAGNSLGEDVPSVGDDAPRSNHREQQRARWTLAKADHLLQEVQDRKFELRTLLENARTTSAALKDLLTLKQQQAGVIEAREAVMQGRQTLKQGRSIMVFTVVTITFLPLSYFATLFGMNAAELNDGNYTLSQEFIYMFPTSAGIITISLLLAFSHVFTNDLTLLLYSVWSFLYNTVVTWLVVKTGLYMFGRDMGVVAARLRDKETKLTGSWKAEIRREKSNIEKLRAADAMRAMAIPKVGRRDDDGGRSTPLPFSPYVTSPSPGRVMSPLNRGKVPGVSEHDVEMGHWHSGSDGSRSDYFRER